MPPFIESPRLRPWLLCLYLSLHLLLDRAPEGVLVIGMFERLEDYRYVRRWQIEMANCFGITAAWRQLSVLC